MLYKNLSQIHNKLFRCFSKLAFSLPEVLVAVTVLGVLGAVLIPAVIKITPSSNKAMFRKSYNTLQQAVSTMINDDTNYPASQLSGSTPKGFNYTTATSNSTTDKFCYFLADNLNYVGALGCPTTSAAAGMSTIFTTTDGIVWSMYLPANDGTPDTQFPIGAASYSTKIVIDVNGPSKGPNCSADSSFPGSYTPPGTATPAYAICSVTADCSKNPDTFVVGIRYDGKLQSSITGTSDACATYILSNPTDNQK